MSTAAGAMNLAPTNCTRFPLGSRATESERGSGLTVETFPGPGSVTWLQITIRVTVRVVIITRNTTRNVLMSSFLWTLVRRASSGLRRLSSVSVRSGPSPEISGAEEWRHRPPGTGQSQLISSQNALKYSLHRLID